MKKQPLNKEIALRIGLASRTLPDIQPASLMQVLIQLLELPLNKKKLASLDFSSFKKASDEILGDLQDDHVKEILSILKTEQIYDKTEILPPVSAYSEGDLQDSVRIACASNHAEENDGHFGSCKRFLIYQVSKQEIRLIDIRSCAMPSDAEYEDKNAWRADLIKDCQILFTVSIGGPAAAKVVRAGVHPIKRNDVMPAVKAIEEIQGRLDETAPPWLAKAMGQKAEERIRFTPEEAYG